MSTQGTSGVRRSSPGFAFGLVLGLALMALGPAHVVGASPSAEPTTDTSPVATSAPSDAACASLDDLRLIVEFVEGTDVAEDGWLPIFVGVIAGLSETRQLADALGDTYRPLVDDLTVALESLGTAVGGLRDADTIGSGIAAVGEAVTDVGNGLDALSAQMPLPCPTSAPAATMALRG